MFMNLYQCIFSSLKTCRSSADAKPPIFAKVHRNEIIAFVSFLVLFSILKSLSETETCKFWTSATSIFM